MVVSQMAAPCLKLSCKAWHFGPTGGAVDRACPFCGDPPADSLTHFVACPALFDTVLEVLPRLPELFGVGATLPRRVLLGAVLDGLSAVMVAHQRPTSAARLTFKARLDVMAGLSLICPKC